MYAPAPVSRASTPYTAVAKVNVTTSATADASMKRRINDAKFMCPVPGCGSTFTRHFNLKGHMRSHNDEKPFQCKWPGCLKGFARQHDCKRHEQLHSNHRPFTCEGCKKPFARLDALNRHRAYLLPLLRAVCLYTYIFFVLFWGLVGRRSAFGRWRGMCEDAGGAGRGRCGRAGGAGGRGRGGEDGGDGRERVGRADDVACPPPLSRRRRRRRPRPRPRCIYALRRTHHGLPRALSPPITSSHAAYPPPRFSCVRS
ncbi:hypothetical protein OF83DRAFT_1069511 [Amylostereum chailletii]|nr:hypothetical protein OF83DRAFT_1069511 [Amylostereum chailletii]